MSNELNYNKVIYKLILIICHSKVQANINIYILGNQFCSFILHKYNLLVPNNRDYISPCFIILSPEPPHLRLPPTSQQHFLLSLSSPLHSLTIITTLFPHYHHHFIPSLYHHQHLTPHHHLLPHHHQHHFITSLTTLSH